MAICKLCILEKPLLESHLMPRHVFKQSGLTTKKDPVVIIDMHQKRTDWIENTVWDGDKEFLFCQKCENIIGIYEDYFAKVFYNETIPKSYNVSTIEKEFGNEKLIEYQGLNYTYIKLYYLSIFYKLSVSSKRQGRGLGEKHSEIIRNLLLKNEAGSDDYYKIMRVRPMTRRIDSSILLPLMPFKLENNQGTYWIGVFGNATVILKISATGIIPGGINHNFELFRLKPDGTMTEWLVSDDVWKSVNKHILQQLHVKAGMEKMIKPKL